MDNDFTEHLHSDHLDPEDECDVHELCLGDCRDGFYDDEDPDGYAELEDLRAIPPLRRPEEMPLVRNQADLHRHWRALMGQLGFSQPRLYLQLFTADGACTPVVLDIVDLPDLPDQGMADALMRFCSQAIDAVGEPGTRVGILYARPGNHSGRAVDRTWARHLTEAGRRHGVPLFPVHVANDEELVVIPPDELVQPA